MIDEPLVDGCSAQRAGPVEVRELGDRPTGHVAGAGSFDHRVDLCAGGDQLVDDLGEPEGGGHAQRSVGWSVRIEQFDVGASVEEGADDG